MTKEDLVCGLNEDLAAELGTVIRYTYQAAQCYGLLAAELRKLLAKEAQDELGHAAFLIDCITLSGSGEPTLHSRLGEIIEQIHAAGYRHETAS